MIILAAILLFAGIPSSVYAEIADKNSVSQPWFGLKDMSPYLDAVSGTVNDELDIDEEMTYHGLISLWMKEKAAVFTGEYDPTISGKEQKILQVTLNEGAKGKYRLDELWIGENVSDVQAFLDSKDYILDFEKDLENASYGRSYKNSDVGYSVDVTYDQYGCAMRIAYRYSSLGQ